MYDCAQCLLFNAGLDKLEDFRTISSRHCMRLWIAAIFLFLFACQALPVAALGKALAKSQVSLEDANSADDEGDNAAPDGIKLKKGALAMEDFVHNGTDASLFFTVQAKRMLFLHRADHLPVFYPGEVTTPPPDFC